MSSNTQNQSEAQQKAAGEEGGCAEGCASTIVEFILVLASPFILKLVLAFFFGFLDPYYGLLLLFGIVVLALGLWTRIKLWGEATVEWLSVVLLAGVLVCFSYGYYLLERREDAQGLLWCGLSAACLVAFFVVGRVGDAERGSTEGTRE